MFKKTVKSPGTPHNKSFPLTWLKTKMLILYRDFCIPRENWDVSFDLPKSKRFFYPLIRSYFLAVSSRRVYTYGNNNKGYTQSSCILKEKREYEIYYYILKHSVNMALMGCMGRLCCVRFRCLENQTVFRSCKYTLSSFCFHEKWHSSAKHCYIRTNTETEIIHFCVTSYNFITTVSTPSPAVTSSQPNSHTQLCTYCRNSPSQNRATCSGNHQAYHHKSV